MHYICSSGLKDASEAERRASALSEELKDDRMERKRLKDRIYKMKKGGVPVPEELKEKYEGCRKKIGSMTEELRLCEGVCRRAEGIERNLQTIQREEKEVKINELGR